MNILLSTAMLALVASGCAPAVAPPTEAAAVIEATVPDAAQTVTATSEWPQMIVYKSPSCGCCGAWVEHMRAAGFMVEVRNQDDLGPIKARMGVPYGKGSCHTAEVGGYLVEGHVPADDIKRLLTQKPEVKGLVLPGMPIGSPGMEAPDGRIDAYTVEAVQRDGSTQPYANHGG